MKARNFRAYAALVAIATLMGLSSCVSNYVGIESMSENNPAAPGSVSYKNTELTAQFDTTVSQLFTVEQTVKGDRVYKQGGETKREFIAQDLDVNAIFTLTPNPVYVQEEAMLSNVELVSSSKGDETKETKRKNGLCTETVKASYNFNLNAGEVVTAQTVYQILKCEVADTTFACASIASVEYDRFEAKKNEKVSNAEQTVFDINLFFNVTLKCDKKPELVNATYEVRVPYQRIYTDGSLTVVENKDYESEFETAVNHLYTVRQNVSGDFVTYKNNEEVSRDEFKKNINLEALFTAPEVVYVDSEEELTKVEMTASAHGGNVVDSAEENGFTTTSTKRSYSFRFNEGEEITSATEFQSLNYGEEEFDFSAIRNVSYKTYEASLNEARSFVDVKVMDIVLYFDVEVARESLTATKASDEVENYTVAVPYKRVLRLEDEVTAKRAEDVQRVIVDENTERISWTEVTTWSVTGEKSETISFDLYRHFNEPQEQMVYTENTQYTTVANGSVFVKESESTEGNWTVTTRYMSYSSTADNGFDAFQNVYSYDYQKAVFANEFYTLSFDYADWAVTEGNSSVSAKAGETEKDYIVYNIYNYVNNVNTVYSVDSNSFDATAKAVTKLAVAKPIDNIIPDEWGNVIGAGISAVPSDHIAANRAMKCLTIRTEKGAVAVVFEMDANVPTAGMIQGAYFVEGNFGAEYNSGFFTTSVNKGNYSLNKWAPAIAKDETDRIRYYNGSNVVANVKFSTLNMWNWRDGNNSTVVEGYGFFVKNGILTITLNGKIAMQLR